ncbi:MAG TPA: protein-glutamate O-methyltransferase CheR [Pseudomonadales bacterium]|nr:protein-glutamate O-methyltransferase CheR [Pseudomonadales bacterium]
MTDRDFAYISELMGRRVGINLTERKRELVYGRLSSRIRTLGLDSFRAYCEVLGGDEEEIARCINSLTTNVTRFFREDHHFDFLRTWIRERDAAVDKGHGERSLRIWSAGCSSGEEAYSIAITLLDSGVDLRRWRIELLATDIDTNMLEKARMGIYPRAVMNEMTKPERWFLRGVNGNDGQVRLKPALRSMVALAPLNLLGDWPDLGVFDLIFCRNVIIYFTAENRLRLLGRFAEHLAVGSHLVLGHSESIHGMGHQFQIVGRTINRKYA